MELRKGFKQTEIGVIPEDWDIVSIGDVGRKFLNGGTPSTKKTEYWEGSIPWITGADLVNQKVSMVRRFITKDAIKNSSTNLVEKNNLLIATRTGVGKLAIAPFDVAISQDLTGMYPREEIVLSAFLFRYLDYRAKDLRKVNQGTSIEGITRETLLAFKFLVPPRPEQHIIAAALSDVDALLDTLDELIAKKRLIKQGAMQELLTGKRRVPGFSGKGYKQADIGIIPEDWGIRHLEELFEITSSKRVFQSEWKTSGIPFYRARELAVLGEQGYVNNELFIGEEMYEAYKAAYGVPQIGDMLVTGVGTLGKVYVISNDQKFYFKDGNIIWFKLSNKVNPHFLRQLYLTPLITKQIADGSAGTTVGTYTISGAKKTTIPFPSLAEQAAIAEILSDMDAEIAALEARREKTRLLKQGMMQELLTGRIRLV